MEWARWVVIGLAFILGGWLAFDGGRALVVGEYVTPSSGKYAGKLGPWSKVVSAVGIDPQSTLMKAIHVVVGGSMLVVMVCFMLRFPWAQRGMLACAVACLWYLPFGTLISIILIVLLLLMP